MPTITLPDGTTHEVSLDAVVFTPGETPAGFVTTDHLASEVKRRVAGAKRSAETELLSSDDFWRQAAEARGIELREDGMPKGASRDDETARARWEAQHLAPVRTQLQTAQDQVARLRSRALEADLVSAAAELGMSEALLKPLAPGTPPPLVTMTRDAFVYDDDSDGWALKGESGVRYGADGHVAGARTLVEEMKANEAYKAYFRPTTMSGPGIAKPGSSDGKRWTEAEIESLSLEDYQRHREAIQQAYREGRIN